MKGMKREIGGHIVFAALIFILASLVRNYVGFAYWEYYVGIFIGTLLPDLDHILYMYIHPTELTSQRFQALAGRKSFLPALDLLYHTRRERTDMLFHSAFFQVLFTVFAFLVVTSSGSLLGEGIVLAFLLHLTFDQFIDLTQVHSLKSWFDHSGIVISSNQASIYAVGMFLLTLLFVFVF